MRLLASAVLAVTLPAAIVLPHTTPGAAASSPIAMSGIYGDPVAITDPANPSDEIFATGVNDSGVVSGDEQIGRNRGVVTWSYTGTASNPKIRIVHMGLPPDSGKNLGMYSFGIGNSGSVYGESIFYFKDLNPNLAEPGNHAVRWSAKGAGGDLGFGIVDAVSSGDAIAGLTGVDTGVTVPPTKAKFTCGIFSDPDGASVKTVTPTAMKSPCIGRTDSGPYLDDPLFEMVPVLGVNDKGVAVYSHDEGFWTTLGAKLANYCTPGATPPGVGEYAQPTIISNTNIVIGRTCAAQGSQGAVWNAATGAMTPLQGDGASFPAQPTVITAGGEIFGGVGNLAAMWPSYTSSPTLLSNVYVPNFVSDNGEYLLAPSPSGSGPLALYTQVPGLALNAPNPTTIKAKGATPLDLTATVTVTGPKAISNAKVNVKLSPSLVVPTGSSVTATVGSVAAHSSKTIPVPGGKLNPTVISDGHTLAGINAWAADQDHWHAPVQTGVEFGGGYLVYSDYPEYLSPSTAVSKGVSGGNGVEGVLYAERGPTTFAATPSQHDFRVYFNHENRTADPKQICIVFSATGPGESITQGATGIAESPGDPVAAGRNALLAYLGSTGVEHSRANAISSTIRRAGKSPKKANVMVNCPASALLPSKPAPTAKNPTTPNPVVNGIIDFTGDGPASVHVGLVILDANNVGKFKANPLGYQFVDSKHLKGNPKQTYQTDGLVNPDESTGHVSGTFDYDEIRMTLWQPYQGPCREDCIPPTTTTPARRMAGLLPVRPKRVKRPKTPMNIDRLSTPTNTTTGTTA